MTTAFYTTIELYNGVTETAVVCRAHALGYELVRFEGWSDSDKTTMLKNRAMLNEIADSFLKHYPDGTYDCIVIHATKQED